MSAKPEPKVNKHICDFLTHCDDECRNIVNPYMNGIERILCDAHGNNAYYKIPFALKSICSAYYCQHLQHRLSFKALFAQYPTNDRLLFAYEHSQCNQHWESCPSIQRITRVLSNFQCYLHTQPNASIAPYVTYRHYQIKQILSDVRHINHTHSQNMVKFYIKNTVISQPELECISDCTEYRYTDINTLTTMDEMLQYNVSTIHEEFIHHSESKLQFEMALNRIVARNDSPTTTNMRYLLSTLRSVAKKLYKTDVHKYRTLEVQRRLMGFDGVSHFLSLLGFESTARGTKLICNHPPSRQVIRDAITVIDTYRTSVETHSLDIYVFISSLKHARVTDPKRIGAESSLHETSDASHYLSRSLQLNSSDTDYIDIAEHMAAATAVAADNGNGGVRSWFGDKWKRMNAKGRGRRKV